MEFYERVSGARMHAAYFRPGGVAFDLPIGLSSVLILSIDCGTELAPAISLAYEKQEGDVMLQKPRNVKTDRLVSWNLLSYSYLIMGNIELLLAYFSFFMVFYKYNIPGSAIWGKANQYFIPTANDYYGLNAEQQVNILTEAQSAFYVTVVFCQFFHIWMCKTRRVSFFQHGIGGNMMMIYGAVIEMALLVVIVYVPFLQPVFGSHAIDALYWTPALLFFPVCWIYNEVRKYYIRKHPFGRVAKLLLW